MTQSVTRSPSADSAPMPVASPGVFAALDLGTNNCRLLIAEPSSQGRLRVLESYSSVVRLGEGVQRTGMLQDAAMQRTLDALRICSEKLAYHPVTDGWFVTTQACRVARNAKAFLNRVKRETGLDLRIIPERDEALLAFLGCSPLLDARADYAVLLDIGGGSTELMLVDIHGGERPAIAHWQSFPIGVMNLFEAVGDVPMDASGFFMLTDEIAREIQSFLQSPSMQAIGDTSHVQLLCTSGTATTLGALQLGMRYYDRSRVDGMRLETPSILNLTERLLRMSAAERARHPCIGEDRAPFLLPGAAILHAVCRQLMVPAVTVADRGVREGIIFSLMQKHQAL